MPAIEHFLSSPELAAPHHYGLRATFNATYPGRTGAASGWVSPWNYGINQGPIVLMIENYLSGAAWSLMRSCPYIVSGLRRAGFTGGWLEHVG